MTRIHAQLALLAVGFLIATLVMGLWTGGRLNEMWRLEYRLREAERDTAHSPHSAASWRQPSDELDPEAVQQAARLHRLMGIAAALVVMLVNGITVTYFVGTSRWCREVVETYCLDPALTRESATLKRRTFPWTLCAMLSIVGVAALGALSDPMTGQAGTWDLLIWHHLAALSAIAFIALVFYVQRLNIAAHHAVIKRIMQQVRRIRAQRGLEV